MNFNRFDIKQDGEALDLCKQYSDDPDKLEELVNNITISLKFTGIHKYFPEDKEERLCGNFEILKKEGSKAIDFDFGFSLNDTELFTDKKLYYNSLRPKHRAIKEFYYGLLYSVLCSVKAGYFVEDRFDYFCDEFGYNKDSIRDRQTHERCLEQKDKLRQIFTEEDIDCLPS